MTYGNLTRYGEVGWSSLGGAECIGGAQRVAVHGRSRERGQVLCGMDRFSGNTAQSFGGRDLLLRQIQPWRQTAQQDLPGLIRGQYVKEFGLRPPLKTLRMSGLVSVGRIESLVLYSNGRDY